MRLSIVNTCVLAAIQLIYFGYSKCEYTEMKNSTTLSTLTPLLETSTTSRKADPASATSSFTRSLVSSSSLSVSKSTPKVNITQATTKGPASAEMKNSTTLATLTHLLETSTTSSKADPSSATSSSTRSLASSYSSSVSNLTQKVNITQATTEALTTTTEKICNKGDYSLNFNISEIQFNEVKFEWDQPTCTGKEKPVKSYELTIETPRENYKFSYTSNETSITIFNGSDTELTAQSTVFIPCERYHATLAAKLENGVITEARQSFTIPLNINNPLESSGPIQQERGPGWVSLSWNMGNSCSLNYDNGFLENHQSLSFVKLEISGGRGMTKPRILNLSMECADWVSDQSQVRFNLTNSSDKCSYQWKWAPCSDYALKLTPMLHDRTTNTATESTSATLSVRTIIENNTTDAKVENLTLISKGSNWLFLSWKRPSCLSDASTLYKVVAKIPSSSWSTCHQNLTAIDIHQQLVENGEFYDAYNLTTCNQPLKPCTNYSIRVRGEYEFVNTNYRRSSDLNVETGLPSMSRLEIAIISQNQLELTWFEFESCTNYPLLKYNLSIKEDVNPMAQMKEVDITNCNKSGVSDDKKKCATIIQVLPCTRYEFKVLPVYRNYTGYITPSTVSHTMEFPDISEDYNMTVGESGSNWAMLNFTFNPKCLPYVQNLSLTLIDDDPTTLKQEIFPTAYFNDTQSGIVLLNLTKSSNFPGFHGFQSCTGRYTVKVRPILKKYHLKSELATGIQLTRQTPSISYASIADRGSNWIFLVWVAPHCQTNLFRIESYLVSLVDATQNCSMTIPYPFTSKNISSSVNCTNSKDVMEIKPCAEYHFQVKPNFGEPQLNAQASFTLSNRIHTLPESNQFFIQNFTMPDPNSTPLRFTWDPPICSHYLKDYQLDFQDNFGENFSAIISPSCLTNNELLWPPAHNLSHCQISTTPKRNSFKLEPCTKYTLQLRPRVNEVSKDHIPARPQMVTFSTGSAKPGKVTSLTVKNATDRSLMIEWGNVTENWRCLSSYEVTRHSDNKICVASVTATSQTHTFDQLEPCTTYSIDVKSVGVDNVSESVGITGSTNVPNYIPQRKMEFSYVGSTALNLTWEKLPLYSRCHYAYSVEIYQHLQSGQQLSLGKRITMDTHMYFADLQSETLYGFCLVPLTISGKVETFATRRTLEGPAAANYMAFAFYILLAIICTTLLNSVVGWCYVKRPQKVCFSLSKKQLGKRTNGSGHSIQRNHMPSNYSMRNIATNRPILIEDFDDVLSRFMEESSTLLEDEYKDLKCLSNEDQPRVYATKPENKEKNRYINILPYDHSRVELSSVKGDQNGDYINASFIQGFNGSREYIAAQGPKPNTLDDYWRMLWEQDVHMLVMLTLVEEKEKIKCAQYWPELGQTICYGDIKVTQVLQINMDNYVIRDLDVECNGEKRSIKQMHFLTWPDFGCPENPETLVSFVEAVRDRVPPGSTKQPILVHCSAGVGRTGTFIVVDWLMQEARVRDRVDVFNTVLKIRYNRVNMVQTDDQYFFIHQCLSHFFKTRLHMKSSSTSGAGSKMLELPKSNQTLQSSRGTLHESQVNLTDIQVESD